MWPSAAYSYVLDKEQRAGPRRQLNGPLGKKEHTCAVPRFATAKKLTAAAVTVALARIVPLAQAADKGRRRIH